MYEIKDIIRNNYRLQILIYTAGMFNSTKISNRWQTIFLAELRGQKDKIIELCPKYLVDRTGIEPAKSPW